MRKVDLVVWASCVVCISLGSTAAGADATLSDQKLVVARNDQDPGQELLMFFEEQDLVSTGVKLHYDHYGQDPYAKIYPDGFMGAYPNGMVGKPLLKDRTTGACDPTISSRQKKRIFSLTDCHRVVYKRQK